MQHAHGLLPAPREPLQAVRNLATRLGQVGAASLIEKPLAALALLPLDVPGEPATHRTPCQGFREMGCVDAPAWHAGRACSRPKFLSRLQVYGVWRKVGDPMDSSTYHSAMPADCCAVVLMPLDALGRAAFCHIPLNVVILDTDTVNDAHGGGNQDQATLPTSSRQHQ